MAPSRSWVEAARNGSRSKTVVSDAAGEVVIVAVREQVLIETRDHWRPWLAEHHAQSPGIWLVRRKTGSGHLALGYDDVVEEAIAYGWVESQARSLDDQRSQLLLTPRNPASSWSRVNRAGPQRVGGGGDIVRVVVAELEHQPEAFL